MTKSHSDKFYLIDLNTHLKWVLRDLERGEIYGVPEELFFRPNSNDPFRMERYGQLLETPIGVAAGPQTQLVQNIVASWLTGARYIELKTVQVLDEIEVTKPCIDMADEGYNCEWSQELKLDQTFDEYLNAFIMVHVLKDKLKIGSPDEPGFIFNMSAGYNLEGILSPAVQRFLDRLGDCSKELAEKIEKAAEIYPRIRDLKIPGKISNSLTVSTMHGCPPDEIEKIGAYFIENRKYDTTIKLNPTLIGPDRLREILNTILGYQTWVPDEAFGHDLKYVDGLPLIKSLVEKAKKTGVHFALKMTNTLETQNQLQYLPKNEKMVYMSGRSLHCISVNLAAKLQKEFNGTLDMSFSAGADYKNIDELIASGLKPVTISSDALRPGGYGRLSQYLETLRASMGSLKASNINEFIKAKSGVDSVEQGALKNLTNYAEAVLKDPRYKKDNYVYNNGVKTKRELPKFNCAGAPCLETCAASQDIPRYLDYTARGEFDKAYATILATNPFPHVQGMVCDHKCQFKCTRLNYDSPLKIREIKRFIAENHNGGTGCVAGKCNNLSVAIIGAGPSGLSAAHYLAIAGFKVEVFEAKAFAGGMAKDAIPAFRLDDASLNKDIDNILALGVKLHLNSPIDAAKFAQLRKDYNYVYLAIGAQDNTRLGIEGEDNQGVWDQLSFLAMVRQGKKVELGNKVIVLGAGNSAMDVARTAKRLVGSKGEVQIVYRRTRREMPADPDEILEALEEDIKVIELASPEKIISKNGKVTALQVAKMKLGEIDSSGRAKPVKTGESYQIEADNVIVAIGQNVRLDAWTEDKLTMDEKTGATVIAGVYTGGDAGRGADSLIQAIADGRVAAESIVKEAKVSAKLPEAPVDDRVVNVKELRVKQARRGYGPLPKHKAPADRLNFDIFTTTYSKQEAIEEASRCLQCDLVCNVCATVCPNRANVAIPGQNLAYPVQKACLDGSAVKIETCCEIKADQAYQIINLADFCNECGNCAFFCPTSGAPYRDKYRVHLSVNSLQDSGNGFHICCEKQMMIKWDGKDAVLKDEGACLNYEDEQMCVELDKKTFAAKKVVMKNAVKEVDLRQAAESAVLWTLIKDISPFCKK